jgi:hypothetical protein
MERDMAPKKDRGSRTETLSLRLDPKTKFILEFVARINGQTLTVIVERAIRASCDEVEIGTNGQFSKGSNWRDFWDPDDGVRILKLLACEDYPSNFDEDELRQFTREHWEFFYDKSNYQTPRRSYLQILWPKIEEYRRIWRDRRDTDYWAAGRAMATDLGAAKIEVPEWPRQKKEASFKRDEMDDEIPF